MSICVWATQSDVPGKVCKDARLTNKDAWFTSLFKRKVTSKDQLYGQAGWDIGINFQTMDDLAGQLESLSLPNGEAIKGKIQRLAINAHGTVGHIFINGVHAEDLSSETIPAFKTKLIRIGLLLPDSSADNAVVLFVGCLVAAGQPGKKLLIELSKIWPNRKVVGFISLGYVAGGEMLRSGEGCTEPGMRDTAEDAPTGADRVAGRYWPDLKTWPWATENSPRATVALNAQIIKAGH